MREAVRVLDFHRLAALAHAVLQRGERRREDFVELRAVLPAHLFPPLRRILRVLHHRGRQRIALFRRLLRAVLREIMVEDALLQRLLLAQRALAPLPDGVERRLRALAHARHALRLRRERRRVEEFRRARRLRELLARDGDRPLLVDRLLQLLVREPRRLRDRAQVLHAMLLRRRHLRIDVHRLEARPLQLAAQNLLRHLRRVLLQAAVFERLLQPLEHRRAEHRPLRFPPVPCLERRLMAQRRRAAEAARHRAARARHECKAQRPRQHLHARLQAAHRHVMQRIHANRCFARVRRDLVVHHIVRHRHQPRHRRARRRRLQHVHTAVSRERLHRLHRARIHLRPRDHVRRDACRVRRALQRLPEHPEIRHAERRIHEPVRLRIVPARLPREQGAPVLLRQLPECMILLARHRAAHSFEEPHASGHLCRRLRETPGLHDAREIPHQEPAEAREPRRPARRSARRRADARQHRARSAARPRRRQHPRRRVLRRHLDLLCQHRDETRHRARHHRHRLVENRRQLLLPLLLLHLLLQLHRPLAVLVRRRAAPDLVLQVVVLQLEIAELQHRLEALDDPVRRAHLCHMMQRERRVLRVHVRHVPELRVRLPHRVHGELVPERVLHLLRVVIHAERFLVRRLVLQKRICRNARHRLDLPRPLQLLLVRLEIFEERLRTAETLRRPAARLRRIIHLIADDMACLARKSPCKIRRRVHHDRAVLLRVRERLVLCRVVPRLLCLCEIFLRERRRDRLLRVEYAIICLRQA